MAPFAEIEQLELSTQIQDVWRTLIQNCILNWDNSDIRPSNEWLIEVIQNNVMGNEFCRSKELLKAVQEQASARNMDSRINEELPVLCWCVEVLEGSFSIANALIHNENESGVNDVHDLGISAINDAFMLENAVYHVLTKFMCNGSSKAEILAIFRRYTFQRHLKARYVFGFDKEKEDQGKISKSFALALAGAWLNVPNRINHSNGLSNIRIEVVNA